MTSLLWMGLTGKRRLYTLRMGTLQDVTTIQPVVRSTPTRSHVLFSAARYLAGKALTILVTIFIGVLVTVLVMNYPAGRGVEATFSPFEAYLEGQIDSLLKLSIHNNIIPRDAFGVPVQQEVAKKTCETSISRGSR